MTYRIDEDSIIDRIDHARFNADDEAADEALKGALKKTIHELCEYSRNILNDVEKKILSPERPHTIGEIAIALVSNAGGSSNQNTDPAFAKMADASNICFINADHDGFKKIVGDVDSEKIYEGVYRLGKDAVKYQYKLKFDDRYLRQQNLLFRLASLYKVENAVIRSPYIRKVVRVCPLDEIPDKALDQDPQFEKNNIPVIKNVNLFWNLHISQTDLIKADGRIPYGKETKYKYHFKRSKEGYWRYAIPQNNQTIIYQTEFSEDGIDLLLDHEMEAFLVVEYRPINWDKLEVKKLDGLNRIHSNSVTRSTISNPRIISEGDIAFAIHPFRKFNQIKCEIAEDLEKVCARYSAKYRVQMQKRFAYASLKRVNLKFFSDFPPDFYDDEINFILLYLEYYYPEIEWVGGW